MVKNIIICSICNRIWRKLWAKSFNSWNRKQKIVDGVATKGNCLIVYWSGFLNLWPHCQLIVNCQDKIIFWKEKDNDCSASSMKIIANTDLRSLTLIVSTKLAWPYFLIKARESRILYIIIKIVNKFQLTILNVFQIFWNGQHNVYSGSCAKIIPNTDVKSWTSIVSTKLARPYSVLEPWKGRFWHILKIVSKF